VARKIYDPEDGGMAMEAYVEAIDASTSVERKAGAAGRSRRYKR
jgi:hypothetical protein